MKLVIEHPRWSWVDSVITSNSTTDIVADCESVLSYLMSDPYIIKANVRSEVNDEADRLHGRHGHSNER